MIDVSVILTAVPLLAVVVALFAFVGCGFSPTLISISPNVSPLKGWSFGGTQVTIEVNHLDLETIDGVWFYITGVFAGSATVITPPGAPDPTTGYQSFTVSAPPYSGPIDRTGVHVDIQVDYTFRQGGHSSFQANATDKPFTYYPPVTHVQTVAAGANGGRVIIAPALAPLQGEELLVATVQWAGPATPMPWVGGASFQPVPGGGPFAWNSMNIQLFSATNLPLNASVPVSVTLVENSTAPWSLCVSAYDFVDPTTPFPTLVPGDPNYTGKTPDSPPISVKPADLVYAVAYGADPHGRFPGTNSLTAGPGFQAETGAITYTGNGHANDPLVEDSSVTTWMDVAARAENTTQNNNPRGWILALLINGHSDRHDGSPVDWPT
jgi:hypothetical protein